MHLQEIAGVKAVDLPHVPLPENVEAAMPTSSAAATGTRNYCERKIFMLTIFRGLNFQGNKIFVGKSNPL